MSKLIKRIASIAMATAMTATMAATASAVEVQDTFEGHAVLAGIEADTVNKTQFAYTGYGSEQARVYVSMDVDNALTGALLYRSGRTSRTSGNLVVGVMSYVKDSPITIFSAHEIYVGSDKNWNKYLEEYYVVQ